MADNEQKLKAATGRLASLALPITASTSAETGELFAALAKAQAAVGNAITTGRNTEVKRGGVHRYATITDILDVIQKVAGEHDLTHPQFPTFMVSDGILWFVLMTRLAHGASGQWMQSEFCCPVYCFAPQADPSESETPNLGYRPEDRFSRSRPPGGVWPTMHNVGSFVTYARRYALQCIYAVGFAAEDDDGNAASGKSANGEQSAAEAQPVKRGRKKAEPAVEEQPEIVRDDGQGEVALVVPASAVSPFSPPEQSARFMQQPEGVTPAAAMVADPKAQYANFRAACENLGLDGKSHLENIYGVSRFSQLTDGMRDRLMAEMDMRTVAKPMQIDFDGYVAETYGAHRTAANIDDKQFAQLKELLYPGQEMRKNA